MKNKEIEEEAKREGEEAKRARPKGEEAGSTKGRGSEFVVVVFFLSYSFEIIHIGKGH